MKKRVSPFLAGFLTACLLLGMGGAALAASGAVDFNTVGLMVQGVQVAKAGEDYTLENGQQVPATIVYTDATGGGTTYLPARRVAELLEVDIGWDAPTGSVTVGSAPASTQAPAATPAPTPTPVAVQESPVADTVYITATGSKYHRAGCRYLSKSQIAMERGEAQAQGYTACSVCRP